MHEVTDYTKLAAILTRKRGQPAITATSRLALAYWSWARQQIHAHASWSFKYIHEHELRAIIKRKRLVENSYPRISQISDSHALIIPKLLHAGALQRIFQTFCDRRIVTSLF